MKNENIENIYIITKNIDDNSIPNELVIISKDKKVFRTPYDINEHEELVKKFIESKGLNVNDPELLTKSQDVFQIYDEDSFKRGIIDSIIKEDCTVVDKLDDLFSKEDLSSVKKDLKLSKSQRVGTGVIAAGVALTSVGTTIGIKESFEGKEKSEGNVEASGKSEAQANEEELSTKATTTDLLSELSEDNERRIFFETVDMVLSELNTLTLDKKVFALEEDKDAVLKFTTDEIISAMIVLNNYSRDELVEIFGEKELNSAEILSRYQDFAFKMSIYAMNGKAPSAVSKLIRNEENRNWFETIENALVKFNKKQTNENSDKLIRLFAYFYQHGINGTDNLENDEASLNAVKNLVLNMMRGYYDANVEEDYRKYLVVSSASSDFDDKYRDNELSQVQKGEKLKFYLDEAEKGVCTIEVIEEHIKDTIDNLEEEIDEITEIKLGLVKTLSEAEEVELAKKVLEEGLSDEVLAQFKNASQKAKKALEIYRDSLSTIDSSMPSYTEIKSAIDEEYGPFEEIKDDVLYNNRIRGLVKINELSSGNVITKEQWDNMSSEEKLEHAKENGKVVSTTTQTKEEKVDYEDLTPSEKQEADKQKEEIKEEVQIGDETYKGDVKEAAKKGFNDAVSYAEEAGAYKHADVYNRINPKYPTKVPTNGTLSNIAQVAYAFNNEVITINDSQIQKRLASDVATYKKNISDSKMVEAYKSAWINAINEKLSSARAAGKELRKQAEEEYKKAQQLSGKQEETTTKREETTTKKEETTTKKPESTTQKQEPTTQDKTPVVTEKPNKNEIDPNLNPTIADSDEGFDDIYDENYNGYISSDEMDDVFAYYADEIIEETTTKVLRK